MKFDDKFWFSVVLLAGVCFLFALSTEYLDSTPKTQQQRVYERYCSSKWSGSRPQCWSEKDWKVYCMKVECKDFVKPEKFE